MKSILLTGLIGLTIFAQKKDKWDVKEAYSSYKDISFTVSEGTWMNLDVSPDGKTIVFDLLGDIYSMSISGGEAKLIAGGPAFEVQPRFSPDGKKILFTSDRAGGDNIWYMNTDGSDMKQITKESFRLVNNAVWMPDGEYIVAKKHFTSGRSLGAGEMWMYHISGGSGVQLTKRKNDQQDVGEPWVSPDGKFVYFSEDMSGGNTFEYNKDPNGQIYVVRRFNVDEDRIENITGGPGGAVRPVTSHNDRYLAFVKRVRLKSVLYLHDLHTGEEWPVYDQLYKDQQETWATFGVYPNYNWTPDDKAIVIWANGKIHKIDVNSQKASKIPFTVNTSHRIIDIPLFKQDVSPDRFTAKMLRDGTTSPDGKLLVFNAAGYLWKKELPNGKPERISESRDYEFFPDFSPDGRYVTYVSWNDQSKASVNTMRVSNGNSEKLTSEPGYYYEPKYSADGKRVVYRKGSGNYTLGLSYGKNTGLYWISSEGGKANFITRSGTQPRFSRDGKRVMFMSYENGNKAYKSVDLNGEDEKTLFTSEYALDITPSPDENWVAFRILFNTYIAAFPPSGRTLDLSENMKSVPVFRVTRDAGDYLHWSKDSKTLHWMLGEEYFSRKISDSFAFVQNAADSIMPPDTVGLKVNLVLKTDKPSGRLALTNARIITMNGNEVIENGTIVINSNRIESIGPSAFVSIPADAKKIDVSGKTIIPGIVDVHAHLRGSSGISPQQSWSYYANLAFGVTTAHDPSANSEMVFSQSEMVKAGHMVGPRVYSTGTILYGAEGDFKAVINSYSDALSHMRRMKALGAFSVKSYNQPRREQRQQIIKAAHELQMMVYPEGGSFFFHNMSMILDGHTGIEHSIPVSPLYQDVVQLWKGSKTGYTPTLVVSYGGIWGENYWYQKTNVWENQHLLKYTPRGIVDSRSRRRMLIPDDDFGFISNAESAKVLKDAGVNVQLGAHGQMQGLGAHWELWSFVLGGMSPLQALHVATLGGARYIGMDHEIGSLEKGKLADLVVLDKNPLDNIRNSESVHYTMLNGRLYDAATMNEIGNYDRKRQKFFWENSKYNASFEWHEASHGFLETTCSCFNRN
ncbi:MAG: PD40 domain-containing protein [Calditrichaeota bacterium]|nr:PD40 domain-containing protein [Calditrichota bacterium]